MTSLSPTGGTGIDEYSAAGLPPGLSINTTSGVISGTPDTANASTAEATVTVADNAGNTDTVDIAFPLVAKGDQTLTGFAYGSDTVTFGSAAPAVTEPTGAVGTLGYTASPETVCTVNATTGALTLVGVGECEVTATAASTDHYNEGTASYTVTVAAAGQLVLNVSAIAGDNTVNMAEKADGFSISGDTGTEAGVSVSVTVGGTATLTATSATGTAAWSVSVPPAASYITGTSVSVSVSASKIGFTPPSDVGRTLAVDLVAPTAPGYTAPDSLKVGVAMTSLSPTGGTGIDDYSATGLPPGLSINTTSGVISGAPDTANASTAEATVTVSDNAGNTDTVDIAFPLVAKGDQTLTGFAYGSDTVTFGSAAPAVTEPTGAVGTLGYTASPETVCTVNATTGALTLVGVGECEVTATAASTDHYNEGTASYTVTVAAAGQLVLNVSAIAVDNTVNMAEKADGFSISGDTGTEAGVSVSVTVGGTATLTATSATGTAAWSVAVPPAASYITGTSVSVSVSASKIGFTAPSDVGRTLAVDLVAPTAPGYTGPDSLKVGVAMTSLSPAGGTGIDEYSATGLPSGLSINATTGAITGTPDTAADAASATVTVADNAGNTDTVDIAFPLVAKGDQTLTGFAYGSDTVTFGSAAPAVTEPTGAVGTLGYTASPETVCTVNATTGALTLVGAGECEVTATAASTDHYNEGTATYTVTVAGAGQLVLNVSAIAGDNTVNIAEKADGFSISGDTGSEAGVSVSVTVGGTATLTATSATGTAAWSVAVPPAASYITGTSVSVSVSASKIGFTPPSDVGRTLAVDLVAPTAPGYTAPDSLKVGVAMTSLSPTGGTGIDDYSATGLPSGLSINTTSGVISGTPDTANASTAEATVTVSDNASNRVALTITFPLVAKGDQTLTGFAYGSDTVTFGSAAPAVTEPTGGVGTLGYTASPETVCTVNATTGALTLVGVGECEVTATAGSTDHYNEGTASYTVTVAAAGQLVLNVSAIAGDNTVNIGEKADGFSISGDTGSEAGVSVSVTVGGTATLTATSATGTAAWSVSVPPAASYITGTSVSVSVSASKIGFTAPSDVGRTLAVDLVAPTAPGYTAPDSLKVGVAMTSLSPAGGTGIDEYSATGLPSGLSINTTSGVISGTPDTANASTAEATVTVADNAGNTDTVDIEFPLVAKGDQTLTGFAYGSDTVTFGSAAPAVTEPTGGVGTLGYTASPETVCTVNATTGALTLVGVGECEVTATAASTDHYNEGTATYTVTVAAAGQLVLNVSAIAGDNTVNIGEKADGFSISGDTGTEAGVSVSVTVGGTATLTAASATGTAAWSVAVPPAASYITGTSVSVSVSASEDRVHAAERRGPRAGRGPCGADGAGLHGARLAQGRGGDDVAESHGRHRH